MTSDQIRIGVDFHVFDGIFQGLRTHVLEVFSRAIRIAPEFEFVFLLDQPGKLLAQYPVFGASNSRLVRMSASHPLLRLSIQLPRMQRSLGLDLLHTQYIQPFPNHGPCVVTIHDILFESHPQYFPYSFRARSHVLMKLSAQRAKHVFTVSDFSRKQIHDYYSINPRKISVINNGVDTRRFVPANGPPSHLPGREIQTKGHILSTGRLEPRKNYPTLIRAYLLLDTSLPLVLVGQRHFSYTDLFTLISQLNLSDRVHVLEDVTDQELPSLYQHAALFVFPSWVEGFGIPPLEAMASGIPVVSSSAGALSDTLGNAALLAPPDDPHKLSRAIHRALNEEQLRADLVKRGLRRVKELTWDHAAEETCRIYRFLLQGIR